MRRTAAEANATKEVRTARLYLTLLPLGALAVLAAIYFLTAERRVSRICSTLIQGMKVADVTRVIAANRLDYLQGDPSVAYAVDTTTSDGRRCKLIFKDGILESSTYEPQD